MTQSEHALSRNTLKLLAFLLMFIDHFGALFFPYNIWFRIVGRLSFPLFAYLIADGMQRTHAPWKMIGKLAVFALISQYPYALVFSTHGMEPGLNIFFTLAIGAACCQLFSKWDTCSQGPDVLYRVIGFLFIGAGGGLLGDFLNTDYRSYGVLLIFGFYMMDKYLMKGMPHSIRRSAFVLVLILLYPVSLIQGTMWIQCFSILSGFLMPCNNKRGKSWGMLGYLIYPVHLFVYFAIFSLIS